MLRRICHEFATPGVEPEERRAMFDAMVATMAAIHRLDFTALGLADYGRPGNYFARQLKRWSQQWASFRRGDDDNPLYYGNARGKWDGDTFVVDSRTFIDKFWFSNGGLPHTDLLHLVERFTRSDYNTLKYEVTINDPGAYTRPWSATWNLQWVAEDLPTYYCMDNRP